MTKENWQTVIREIDSYLQNPEMYCGFYSATPESMREYIVNNLKLLLNSTEFNRKVADQAIDLLDRQTIQNLHRVRPCPQELRVYVEAKVGENFRKFSRIP